MGRLWPDISPQRLRKATFPMIPPQVNGATHITVDGVHYPQAVLKFPMIPPQVNGATKSKQFKIDGFGM